MLKKSYKYETTYLSTVVQMDIWVVSSCFPDVGKVTMNSICSEAFITSVEVFLGTVLIHGTAG